MGHRRLSWTFVSSMVAASGWSCADDTIGAGGQGGTSSGGAPSGGNGGAGAGGSMGQFAEGGHGGGCTLGDPCGA